MIEGAPTFSKAVNEFTTDTVKANNTTRKLIMAPSCLLFVVAPRRDAEMREM